MTNNATNVLQSAITGLQQSAYARALDKAGFIFTANAIRSENQKNDILANSVRGFEAVLNSAAGQNDIISKLRSFGIPVIVKDTSKIKKSPGPNGIAIAPNIIKKMEQDEKYAQEIFDEINDFMYNVLPAAERDYALQGARIKWFGIIIDSDGKIIRRTGGVHIDEDEDYIGGIELLIFTRSGKKENNIEISSETLNLNVKDDIDLLAYLSLVGDTNYKSRRSNE